MPPSRLNSTISVTGAMARMRWLVRWPVRWMAARWLTCSAMAAGRARGIQKPRSQALVRAWRWWGQISSWASMAMV